VVHRRGVRAPGEAVRDGRVVHDASHATTVVAPQRARARTLIERHRPGDESPGGIGLAVVHAHAGNAVVDAREHGMARGAVDAPETGGRPGNETTRVVQRDAPDRLTNGLDRA